jgi:peptide-methionine (S)-S-oxide reductase
MKISSFLTALLLFSACASSQKNKKETAAKEHKLNATLTVKPKLQTAVFASGCFWCVEAVFESVEGVDNAISGYSGGQVDNPTYEQVCSGSTGHAESVLVVYDSTKVSYETLLKVFYGSHDPSTLNRQGPDGGTQYRSAIFYEFEYQKVAAEKYITQLKEEKRFSAITTEVSKLTKFYNAEAYHQGYESLHPENSYVINVSVPRLNKFKAQYPELLKK